MNTLTPRQEEVFTLIAQGLSFREIADKLCITEETVDGHARNIFKKLGVHTRPKAQYYAYTHGLIPMQERR